VSLCAGIRSLIPSLPRAVWTLEGAVLANSIGSGIVLPFVMIYLHNVRGITLGTAGLIVSTFAAVSFVMTPVAGSIIDRRGPRMTLATSLVVLAAGFALFPLVREPWQGFACMVVAGIGNGGFWPSQSSLLAVLAGQAQRSSAYAVQRAAFNFGIGLGGVIGGLIATTSRPSTFTALFLLNAATFLVYAIVAAGIRTPPRGEDVRKISERGYRDALGDRALVGVVGLNVIFVTAGYAQLEAVLPVFAKNESGVSEEQIGLLFLVNTLAVTLAQLPVVRLVEGRGRMRALAAMSTIWALAWLIVMGAGLWFEAVAAAALFIVAVALFGIGECVLGPAQSALVADLAPEGLRGRYLALLTNSYAVGFALGPAVGGLILDVSPPALWATAASTLFLAALVALRLDRSVPTTVRLVPSRAV
jgi:MFS family permease